MFTAQGCAQKQDELKQVSKLIEYGLIARTNTCPIQTEHQEPVQGRMEMMHVERF